MSSLQKGYKQTEVGVIPDDWEYQPLSTLTSLPIQNGVFNDPAKKGRGCKLINVGDLYSNIPIDIKSLELFDANKDELTRFCVTHGDVFFTRSSLTPDGIAHCNVYKKEENEDIVFDCHIIRVRANTNKIDPFFLFRYCTASLARKYLVAHAKTTTMTTIDQGVIASLPILVPPLPEQKTIALSLSDTDALITACDRAIGKKRNIKQGTMQQLLTGKMRLPGFSGDWEVKKLGELGTSTRPAIKAGPFGSALKKSFYVKEGYKIYGQEQVIAKDFSIGNYYIDKQHFEYLKSCAIQPNDILISLVGTFGKVVVVPNGVEPGIINPRLIRLSLDLDKVYPYFIKDWLISSTTQQLLEQTSHGGTMGIINAKTLSLLPVTLPPLPEQKAIAQILSDMDAEIAALEKKRDKYKAIKQGMMQELLTGKTRLKEVTTNLVEKGENDPD